MPRILNMTIQKQAGSLSCWVACARCILDHYGTSDTLSQEDLVRVFNKGKETGDPEWILASVSAHRNTLRFNGDELALSNVPLVFLRIKDNINRFEPVVVSLDMAGGGDIGHAMVVYGYDDADGKRDVLLLDPSRPNNPVRVDIVDLMFNAFKPYLDVQVHIRYYARRFVFSQRPRTLASWGLNYAKEHA